MMETVLVYIKNLMLLSLVGCFFTSLGCGIAGDPVTLDLTAGQTSIGWEAEEGEAAAVTAAADWLSEQLARAGGERPSVKQGLEGATIALVHGPSRPEAAAKAGLNTENLDAFAITTADGVVSIYANNAVGLQHGIATLLDELGFRYYNPSPKWWVAPEGERFEVDLNVADQPALDARAIWYAYGASNKTLGALHKQWMIGNRMAAAAPLHVGHSYGSIVSRNTEVFDQHPEYYALLENGERQTGGSPNARKFCVTNEGLLKLVAEDRLALLREYRTKNPREFMVSVDPSDGRGSCTCETCEAVGTTTDRVMYLANHVARYVAEHEPGAWVGLYAYSSHRSPPTIAVEPNVYVQVAMGFNRTPYTLPELVDKWSQKVGAVGIREYYGVEAWDWGLPGRMRGGQVDYHEKWIPYFADRKLNAMNAESNANWAAQTPGGYIAAQLMWDPTIKTEPLLDEYFDLCFGPAADVMRRVQARFDLAPALEPGVLHDIGVDLAEAYSLADDDAARARVVDLLAFFHYMKLFRDFSLTWDTDPDHEGPFYDTLEPLMNFAWRVCDRDMIHYYALARRLCNGLPLKDGRLEFWLALDSKKKPPQKWLDSAGVTAESLPDAAVWKHGEAYSDDQIVAMFRESLASLKEDQVRRVAYSRYLDYSWAPGPDAGPSASPGELKEGAARVHGPAFGYIASQTGDRFQIQVQAVDKPAEVIVYQRGETVLEQAGVEPASGVALIDIELPRANDYRFAIQGVADVSPAVGVPTLLDASLQSPLKVQDSGPLYFYVPRSARDVVLQVTGEWSVGIPRNGTKRVSAKDADADSGYIVLPVPKGAAGTLWNLTAEGVASIALVNTPPLVQLTRQTVVVPRETAQADGLTTLTREEAEATVWK